MHDAAPEREPREVHHRLRHEVAVRHDHLPSVVGAQQRRAERHFLDEPGVAVDVDRVADPERPLDEHPHAGEEVAQDVLEREADDDPDHAERGEDPAERALGVDREDDEDPEGDHRELRQVPEQDRGVPLRPVLSESAHRDPADRPGEDERDGHDDDRPEGPDRVLEEGVAEGCGVHLGRMLGSFLTNEHPFG